MLTLLLQIAHAHNMHANAVNFFGGGQGRGNA